MDDREQRIIRHQDFEIRTNVPLSLERAEGARFEFAWAQSEQAEPYLELFWRTPLLNIQYQWHPNSGLARGLRVDFQGPLYSKISSSAPVTCFFDGAGRNRYTVALSDAATPIGMRYGVHEEDATIHFRVRVPLTGFMRARRYALALYIDENDKTFAQALSDVRAWWERVLPQAPLTPPPAARAPMYSTWYSFHQAISAAQIEAQCVRARELGMETVIMDDGWQAADGNRGYAYCGDWAVCAEKIPDMALHVKAVHDLGMKYMLWYSVPFVGMKSQIWPQFSDKLLSTIERLQVGVLDPRYPCVRAYLIDTYARALTEWDLDGFKLDFIDSFSVNGPIPPANDQMDIANLEEAVQVLMTDAMRALRGVKQDILIEFRQSYIGPLMRTFGNMFRVGDCPADALKNRVGTIDLRLLSGNTAVHSDMLMWHPSETVENAALQLLNVLFAVPQISVRLEQVPAQHVRMLRFWLDFMRSHQALLLDAPLEAEAPHLLYPAVRARAGGEALIATYDPARVLRLPEDAETLFLVNATQSERIPLSLGADARWRAECFDCMGEAAGTACLSGPLAWLEIPKSGLARLTKSRDC